ncbi:hypothetical protein [Profundibacter sp.]
MRFTVRALWFIVIALLLFYAALYFAFFRPGSPLNPDLSDRDNFEVNEIIRWDQNRLIPDCRENYAQTMPGRVCDGTTMQYFQGPAKVPRNGKTYKTDIDFLPNAFANILASATSISEYNTLHERCGEDDIKALSEWAKTDPEINHSDVLTISYLAPDDPWAFCLHQDNHSWDYDLRQGKKPVLERHVFWIWRGGNVVGRAHCSTIERNGPATKTYPQCNINLWFDHGDYAMVIGGGLPAASFRKVLMRLEPITRYFWKHFEPEIEGRDFDKTLFYPPVVLNERAQQMLAKIEVNVT